MADLRVHRAIAIPQPRLESQVEAGAGPKGPSTRVSEADIVTQSSQDGRDHFSDKPACQELLRGIQDSNFGQFCGKR
jgi:hypothetical protein